MAIKYPPDYIPQPKRTEEEVEAEWMRRCGFMPSNQPVNREPVDWKLAQDVRTFPAFKEGRKQTHRPLPKQQSRSTCKHDHGTVKDGPGRVSCRACGKTRKADGVWNVGVRKSQKIKKAEAEAPAVCQLDTESKPL